MAINYKKPDGAEGAPRHLYTGVALMAVVGVNMNPDKTYYDPDKYGMRVEFTLQGEFEGQKFNAFHNVFLRDETAVAKSSGRTCFIDKHGKSGYAMGIDELHDWIDKSSARKAYVGEKDLYDFLSSWMQVEKGGELQLDSFKKLVQGDAWELQGYVKQVEHLRVQVLLGIGETLYQEVYGRRIMPGWNRDMKRLFDNMAANADYLKADYGPVNFRNPAGFDPRAFSLRQWEVQGVDLVQTGGPSPGTVPPPAPGAGKGGPPSPDDSRGNGADPEDFQEESDLPF